MAYNGFYKTRMLSFLGGIILLTTLVLVLVSQLFIPKFTGVRPTKQIYTISGKALKYNTPGIVTDFIMSIKDHNGYLCMGTSESGKLTEGNYYDFLNNDPELGPRFSVLSGAGRTCGQYFPVFAANTKQIEGLQVIYIINPVYWASNLQKPDFDYWTRYADYGLAVSVQRNKTLPASTQRTLDSYNNTLNPANKTLYWIASKLTQLHASLKHDLSNRLFTNVYRQNLEFITPNQTLNPLVFQVKASPNIDTAWNVEHDFMGHKWMSEINNESKFRYNELSGFIDLAKQFNIKPIFVLCPYNELFITHYNKPALAAYQSTTLNIKEMIEASGFPVVDGRMIGSIPGTFIDNQHISSYGAFLLYKKLKTAIHEKEAK